jgi:hypothetical protein
MFKKATDGYVSMVMGVVGCDGWGGGVCWGINYWGCRVFIVNVVPLLLLLYYSLAS